jgi:hypothetical protein
MKVMLYIIIRIEIRLNWRLAGGICRQPCIKDQYGSIGSQTDAILND